MCVRVGTVAPQPVFFKAVFSLWVFGAPSAMASLFAPVDSRASLVEDLTLTEGQRPHALVADCYGNVTSLRPAREAYNAKSLGRKPCYFVFCFLGGATSFDRTEEMNG